MSALSRCVGDVDDFLARHWDREPLLREPEEGVDFDDLSSLDDLDRMIASLGLHASNLRMVKDGKPLPPSAYSVTPGKKGATEALVSAPLVYERYAEGATIVIESLHRYWEPLTDFCRELELALGHRLQVNAYITPPGSQGFDVHRDDHDVFILQVSGAKHWTVYDRDEELMLIDQSIERGAALYIPKGFPHAATTSATASAHLTVGILTHDVVDIVMELSKLAGDEPAFKHRLPVGMDVAALRAAVAAQIDEVRAWLDKVDVDELTERVARRVMTTSQPIMRGQLRQLELLDQIDESTRVARRCGATCLLFPSLTEIKVMLADRELAMPRAAAPAMEFVADRKTFAVRDLHEYLDPESALVLVRRLVTEGLLEVVLAG